MKKIKKFNRKLNGKFNGKFNKNGMIFLLIGFMLLLILFPITGQSFWPEAEAETGARAIAIAGSDDVSVAIAGEEILFSDQTPYIDENDRVMVPVRFVSEELGGVVEWDEQASKVIITRNTDLIELTLDSKEVKVNGLLEELDTKPVLSEAGRTMVPLRFVSQILGREVDWDGQNRIAHISGEETNGLRIESANPEESIYYPGEKVVSELAVSNHSEEDKRVWLGHSVQDQLGSWLDVPARSIEINANTTKETQVSWTVPEKVVSGTYTGVFSLWDSPPAEEAVRLETLEKEEYLSLYNKIQEFKEFPHETWIKRDGARLGQSTLKQENVFTDQDREKLMIKLPSGTTDGGEIQTKEELGFGSYEAKLKLPNAPSSITGFFLYKEPDFYHEIDIEIFNDPSGEYLLTTYADGEVKNEFKGELPFDPTADFNRYRFDYYPDRVEFYMNDDLVQTLEDGYSEEPMRLMVNSWFPTWLEGISPQEDKYLEVDWIRY